MATNGVSRRRIIGAMMVWALPTVPLLAGAVQKDDLHIDFSPAEWVFVPFGAHPMTVEAGTDLCAVRIVGRARRGFSRMATVWASPSIYEIPAEKALLEAELVEFLKRDMERMLGVTQARTGRANLTGGLTQARAA